MGLEIKHKVKRFLVTLNKRVACMVFRW